MLLGLIIWGDNIRAQLISFSWIVSYSTDQIDSIYAVNGVPSSILPSTYSVNVYKVLYETLDKDSLPVIASGAFFIPVAPACHVPLMSYQHGTIFNKVEVPSQLSGGEIIIGFYLASDGYAVCMPDYLGLGDSPGLHPYLHAETEARSVADMLAASLEIFDSISLPWNSQLFLLGYSQGGHATMAAHQLIQEHYNNYFSVTASAPMSGPYDLSGVQAAILSSESEYPNPGYVPYLLLAYHDVYHIYNSISEFLQPPYDETLPPLFDGTHSLGEINDAMPDVPSEIIVPAVLDSFINDPQYKLRYLLDLNNTYNWLPVNPLRMYYCEGDADVSYLNAFVALDSFTAYGSNVVSAQSSGSFLDHGTCAVPSVLNAKGWFDDLRLDKLQLAFDLGYESNDGAADGSLIVHVSSGFPPYTYQWSNGGTDSMINNISSGNYTVSVTDATGCPATTSVYLPLQVGVEELLQQQVSVSPNPFHSQTNIELGSAGNYELIISDFSGKIIMKKRFYGESSLLYREELMTGMYFLHIKNIDGTTIIKKIVIE